MDRGPHPYVRGELVVVIDCSDLDRSAEFFLHQLANPDPAFDPSPQITALVTAVVRPPLEVTAAPRLGRRVVPAQAPRSIGQLIQRGPPRPRPSSPPGTTITSMPLSRR